MRLAALALLLMVGPGCATVGRNFDASGLAWLKSGTTTKAEIVEKLGQPWRVGADAGDPTWTYGYYEYRALGDSNTKDLVLHFTPEGKLKSYTLNTSFPEEKARLDPTLVSTAPAK